MKTTLKEPLVMTVYPRTYGFGFAIFDGPLDPLDWGVYRPRRLLKRREALKRIEELANFYQPDQLIIDSGDIKFGVPLARASRFVKDILQFAQDSGFTAHIYTPDRVKAAFAMLEPNTKFERAKRIVEWLPVLSSRLPEKQKPWMREDYRLGIFEAISLAIAFYYHNEDLSNDQETIHA